MLKNKTILPTIFAAIFLTGCSKDKSVEQVDVVRPVKLIDVAETTNVKKLSFPAVVEALSSKDLTFQVSGQIKSLKVREGQSVKQGEVIAALDERTFQNQLDTAQSQFDRARIEFERGQRLIAENAISQSVYDQRKSQFDIASAQLDTANKALEDTLLRSPFDGVVAIKHAKELDSVSPSAPIVTLQTEGAAEAMVKIPASLVTRSKQIEPLQTVVVLDSAPEDEMSAELVSASTQADERSQTFEVRFGFTPPEDLTILPGMTGVVKASLRMSSGDQPSGQISIPLSAVLSDSNGKYVWKVDPQAMTVIRQNIQVGTGVAESLVVTSGLNAGDTIVGAGASYLSEGMQVRRLKQ